MRNFLIFCVISFGTLFLTKNIVSTVISNVPEEKTGPYLISVILGLPAIYFVMLFFIKKQSPILETEICNWSFFLALLYMGFSCLWSELFFFGLLSTPFALFGIAYRLKKGRWRLAELGYSEALKERSESAQRYDT